MTRNTQLLLTVLVTLFFGALFAVSPAAAENLDFNDQAAGDGTVTVENVSADGTPSVVVVTYESNGDRVVAAFSQTEAFADQDVTLQITDGSAIPGEHTASLIPVTGVSSETQNTGVLSDDTISNIVASETATVGQDSEKPDNGLDFSDQTTTDGAVTVENVTSEEVSVVAVTYESNGDRIVAGNSSFDKFAEEDVTVQIADDSALPGVHTAHLIPVSGISLESADTGTLSDATIANITDNETATISLPRPSFQVRNLKPGNVTVPNGITIEVSADVENIGTVGDTQDITLTIENSAGTEVFSQTKQNVSRTAGENRPVTFSNIDTSALGPGSYTYQITSANDSASSNLSLTGDSDLEFSPQGIENGNVTVENVVSGGVEAAVVVTYQNVSVGGTGLIVAGQSVGTFDGEDVQVTLDDTSALGGNYTAHILPASELSDSTQTSGVVSATTADAIQTSQEAFVSVEVVDGEFARDTTGDGLLNNVRGSDGFNIIDVQALFNNLGTPVLQNNVDAFDFQDDDGINILDVQGLFNQLS